MYGHKKAISLAGTPIQPLNFSSVRLVLDICTPWRLTNLTNNRKALSRLRRLLLFSMITIIHTDCIKTVIFLRQSSFLSPPPPPPPPPIPFHPTKVARWRSISVSTCRQCVPELCKGERSRAFNSFAQATCGLSDRRFCDVREYGLVAIRGMTKTPDKIGKSRKCTSLPPPPPPPPPKKKKKKSGGGVGGGGRRRLA